MMVVIPSLGYFGPAAVAIGTFLARVNAACFFFFFPVLSSRGKIDADGEASDRSAELRQAY